MKAGLSFLYLRDENRFPVACVAIDINEDRLNYKFATSTVNPLDRAKFSKILAKQIAVGRLKKKPTEGMLIVDQYYKPVFSDIAESVVESIADCAPGRITRNAAKRWLKNLDQQP